MPLHLSRRPGQRIFIDGPAMIEFKGFERGNGVLVIAADDRTNISREELMDDDQRTEAEAMTAFAGRTEAGPVRLRHRDAED
jgi:hypothetical protein